MAERVLTTRELNRALLARQLLLERSSLPLPRVLERVAGLQTQYAPSAYIGLWSRMRNFRRDSLTKALVERRAVQGTLMRSTIHIVSAPDYWLFCEAIRKERQRWWLGVQQHQADVLDMPAVAKFVRKHLKKGPRRQAELVELIQNEGLPRIAWSGVHLWLDMVRVPPSGTWEHRRADLYGLAEDWVKPHKASEAESIKHLVHRYLGGFGPASLNDMAKWAHLSVTQLRPAADKMKLRRFRTEQGEELLDIPRAPLPDPDTPAPIRFIPTWDATLLAHARRTQILPEEYRPLVFNTKTPHSVPTFTIDGAVAGKWRHEKGHVKLEPFERLARSVRKELEEAAEELAAFHE